MNILVYNSFELRSLSKVKALVHQVLKYEKEGKPVNMHRAFRSATLDVILVYCFAKDYDVIHTPDFAHELVLDFEFTFPLFLVLKHFPWIFRPLVFLGQISKWLSTRKEGHWGGILQMTSAQVDELLAKPELLESCAHETIYHHLLTPHPEKGKLGEVPSKKSLTEEAENLLAAGSDTVGNACTIGTFHVLNDPAIHAKLVEELRDAWPDKDNDMSYTALEKLPYLVRSSSYPLRDASLTMKLKPQTAVIKESLRMSHGVVLPAPRIVSPEDVVIDGFPVPVGVSGRALFLPLIVSHELDVDRSGDRMHVPPLQQRYISRSLCLPPRAMATP